VPPFSQPSSALRVAFLALVVPSLAGAQDPRAYNVTTQFDEYGNARSFRNPWISARFGLYGVAPDAAPWDYVSATARSVGRPPQFAGRLEAARSGGLVGQPFDYTRGAPVGAAATGTGRPGGGAAVGGPVAQTPGTMPLRVPDLPVRSTIDLTRQRVLGTARLIMAVHPPDVGGAGEVNAAEAVSTEGDGGAVEVGGASQFYQERSATLYQQARARGWAAFREGDFASASYELQTALSLNPGDRVSRLGLLFCEAGAGRFVAAQARMASIIGREGGDALTRTVAFGAQFGAADAYVQTLDQLQRFVMTRRGDLDSAALLVFFLWHAGAERDALEVADQIARQRPDSPYASWSVRLRRTMTRPDAAPPPGPADNAHP